MSPGAIFVTSFVVGLSGALMPGPVLTVTVSGAARKGFKAGPLVVLGHGIAEVSLVVALLFGLGALLKERLFFGFVGIAGGAILLLMGVGLLREKGRFELSAKEGTIGGNILWAGLLATVSNPYFFLWWATVGLTYIIIAQKYGWFGLGLFYSGHILADIVWYFSVAAALSVGKRLITAKGFRILNGACGVFLILLGTYFGSSGIRSLIL